MSGRLSLLHILCFRVLISRCRTKTLLQINCNIRIEILIAILENISIIISNFEDIIVPIANIENTAIHIASLKDITTVSFVKRSQHKALLHQK